MKILCILRLSRKIEGSPFGTSDGEKEKDTRMNINMYMMADVKQS